MPSILESVMSVFDHGDGWTELATAVDGDEGRARSAVEPAVPVVIGGLAGRAEQDDDGRGAVIDLIDAADESMVDEGVVDGDDAHGQAALTCVFGDARGELVDGLAEEGEVETVVMERLLPPVAAAVVAVVARRRTDDDLDDDGVVALLTGERDQLAEEGRLGDWFRGLLAYGRIETLLPGFASRGDDDSDDADGTGDGTGSDEAFGEGELAATDDPADPDDPTDPDDPADGHDGGAVGDDGPVGDGTVAAVAGTGALVGVAARGDVAGDSGVDADRPLDADDPAELDEGVPVAGDVVDLDGAPGDEAVDDADDAAADDADAPGLVGVDGGDRVDLHEEGEDDEDDDGAMVAAPLVATGAGAASGAEETASATTRTVRAAKTPAAATDASTGRRGLGWLWWAVAAVILVILLALILSQCGDDEEADRDAGSSEFAAEDGDLQAEVEAALPAGVRAAIDGDVVTLSGSVETEERATEVVDDVAEIDGVGSVVDQISLTDAAAGDTGGDTGSGSGEAGTGGEEGDEELQAEVDAVLPDGVTARVEGGFVTLSGTVDDEETAVEAYDAVSALDGVSEIVDEIEVAGGDPADDLQAAVDAVLPSGVTASLDGGVVTLSGSVGTEAEAAEAAEAVSAVDGVVSVEDELEVGDDPDSASSDGADASGDGADDSGDGVDDSDSASGDGPGTAPGTNLNEELGLAPITFRYLSGQVTASGAEALDQVVSYLQGNDVRIEIQGHTDSDGSEQKNLELSEQRARAIKEYLVGEGIDPNRLDTVGYGESRPKVPNDSLVAKAENRRIELVVVG